MQVDGWGRVARQELLASRGNSSDSEARAVEASLGRPEASASSNRWCRRERMDDKNDNTTQSADGDRWDSPVPT